MCFVMKTWTLRVREVHQLGVSTKWPQTRRRVDFKLSKDGLDLAFDLFSFTFLDEESKHGYFLQLIGCCTSLSYDRGYVLAAS